jgi:uncharacterized protein YqjF (DUF2071 family)
MPSPFHQNFEEVNVRFYVRRAGLGGEERKGAVFIKELVPRRAIAVVARWFFNENYQRVPMMHRIDLRADGDVGRAEFSWRAGHERCVMALETEGDGFLPAEGSESQFITEHYWGYAAQRDGSAKEYEVRHPQWRVWRAKTARFTGDTASFYGAEIAQILRRGPDSAFLAEGSAVTVFKGTAIYS